MIFLKYVFANQMSSTLGRAVIIATLLVTMAAYAQNPIPQIVGPVKPSAVAPGAGPFTLTVYGANFVPGAVVNWNGQPRSTTFISVRELQTQIPADDVASNTAGLISVTNPAPGGGSSSSSWAQVEVHQPISKVSFAPRKSYPMGVYLLMAADFNHDQTLDLVGEYGNAVVFYPGKGDGTFHFESIASRWFISTGGTYGDFNNDGNLDFAYSQLPTTAGTFGVAVMLGNGKGEFNFGWAVSNYSFPNLDVGLIRTGDFNSDGKLDLILGNYQGFSVFLGNGDGTFRHFSDIVDSAPPYSTANIAVGDFNGDGKLDLIVFANPGGGNPGNYIYFFAGNGDGTFQPEQTIMSTTSVGGAYFQVSDFNGDGKLDLAFSTLTQIAVMLGNGDGTFQAPIYTPVENPQQVYLAYTIGDFYADGVPSLLVQQYINSNDEQFTILRGNGDGTFQQAQVLYEGYTGMQMLVGDFNSDGLLDLITPDGGGLLLYLQE